MSELGCPPKDKSVGTSAFLRDLVLTDLVLTDLALIDLALTERQGALF